MHDPQHTGRQGVLGLRRAETGFSTGQIYGRELSVGWRLGRRDAFLSSQRLRSESVRNGNVEGHLDCTYVTACNRAGQMKTLGLLREITTQQRLLTPKRNIKQRSILPTVLHTALPMSYSGS